MCVISRKVVEVVVVVVNGIVTFSDATLHRTPAWVTLFPHMTHGRREIIEGHACAAGRIIMRR